MTMTSPWLMLAITLCLLLGYLLYMTLSPRHGKQQMAWRAHAKLRDDWFEALSHHSGSEILAVQTLRNALMSATMTASTAALGLVGSVTLAAPSLQPLMAPSLGDAVGALDHLNPRLVLELTLMLLLMASLVASAVAIRFYNHASIIMALPVGSPARDRWTASGKSHLRRAGMLYSWGLRYMVLVSPVLAAIVEPLAGPLAALVVVGILLNFDGVHAEPSA
jgi:uncharacterized membrane protein